MASTENKTRTQTDDISFVSASSIKCVLSTILFLSSFLLLFVIYVHVLTFSHEQYIEGDIRYQKIKAAEFGFSLNDDTVHGTGVLPTAAGPISNQLMTIGYIIEALLLSSILCASTSLLSLCLSGAMDYPHIFKVWKRFFAVVVVIAYLSFIASVFLFLYQIHKSVTLQYPQYASGAKGINQNMKWDADSESFGSEDYVLYSVNDDIFYYNCTVSACVISIFMVVCAHCFVLYVNNKTT